MELRRLRDCVRPDVRVLLVGINPGIRSATIGHHFAGPSNRFWKLLYESGLVPEAIGTEQDRRLPEWGFGVTNLVARATPGMAGADLANMVNEAALLAARRNRKKVTMQDFQDAKDKVMLGMERKSLVMTEDERRNTAYHEAGHALVAWLMPGTDPVDKVTIIPRGRALGITSYLPQEERYSRTRDDLIRASRGFSVSNRGEHDCQIRTDQRGPCRRPVPARRGRGLFPGGPQPSRRSRSCAAGPTSSAPAPTS